MVQNVVEVLVLARVEALTEPPVQCIFERQSVYLAKETRRGTRLGRVKGQVKGQIVGENPAVDKGDGEDLV